MINKKAKKTKKVYRTKKFKFQDFKNCLEAAQIENKINHLEENKTDLDRFKELIKNNKLILKAQQRFKNEKCSAFTEVIAISSDDDQEFISIYLVEISVHRASKDLVCKRKEIKCKNIIKQYKSA